jgi:hypothetical protein
MVRNLGTVIHSRSQSTFEHLFLPLAGKRLFYVEVGVWCGHSFFWMLNHVLTRRHSWAIGIDAWAPFSKYSQTQVDTAYALVDGKCREYGRKARVYRGRSIDVLRSGVVKDEAADIAYIDGDHSSSAALTDMILTFPLLKQGGILLCDDVNTKTGVPQSIDAFMDCFHGQLQELWTPGGTMWACQKTSAARWDESSSLRPVASHRYSHPRITRKWINRGYLTENDRKRLH